MRWGKWRRLVGDTERPDLLDAGKRLLGELDQRRRLGKVTTALSAQRTLPDGSQIRAAFAAGHPLIEVRAAGGDRAVETIDFRGFVTTPRLFGTDPVLDDGQLAFGANAQVILDGKEDDFTGSIAWRSGFYDPPAPAFIGRGFRYKRALPAGIAKAGNIDWTSGDGRIAITWLGPKMRSLSLTSPGWASINSTRRGPCVYCNGAVLIDHSAVAADEKVIGACIARFTSGEHLVYVAYKHDHFGAFGWNAAKVYAVPLRLTGDPRQVADPAAVVLLATGTVPPTNEHKFWPCCFFNQSGTEGRMLRAWVDGDTTDGFTVHFTETVIALGVDGSATLTEVDHGEAAAVRTGTLDLTVGPNLYNVDQTGMVSTAIVESNPTNTPDVVVTAGTCSFTLTAPDGPFPLAVDYQDDVPVYLWWAPGSLAHEGSFAAPWTQNGTGTTQSASIANTSSLSRLHTGGRVYAADKDGTVWLDVAFSSAHNASVIGSAELEQLGYHDPGGSTSFAATMATDFHTTRTHALLWWVDLRNRSAAYSRYTRATRETRTVDTVANGTGDVWEAVPQFVTEYTEDSDTLDVDTRIVFEGVEVEAMATHHHEDNPRTINSTGTNDVYMPGHVLAHRQSADPSFIPTEIHGDTLDAWVQAAKDSFSLVYPTDVNAAVVAPTEDLDVPLSYPSLDFEPTDSTIDGDGTFIHDDLFQSAAGKEWIWQGADRESDAVPTDIGHHNFGTWIAHEGLWAFSMPDLDDVTHADMTVPQYRFGVKGGASLDAITGAHGAELFEAFWPLMPFRFTIT